MHFVVIGGGLSGLIAARSLRASDPNSDITVIEKSHKIGGLLAGNYYPEHSLYFDQGTHIFRETGYSEIDNFLLGSIPRRDLIHFAPGLGDIAGAVFDGQLQRNTHFPDIRRHTNALGLTNTLKERANSVKSINGIDRATPFLPSSAYRFGEEYTQQVLAPLVAHLYQQPASSLASFSFLLPGLTRVAGLNYDEWLTHATEESWRQIFSVPDQRQLPTEYQQRKRSFYSRTLGSSAFIRGMADSLKNEGVKFVTGVNITSLTLDTLTVSYHQQRAESSLLRADGIVLAAGIVGAARILGISLNQFNLDKPLQHRVLHLAMKDTFSSDLCYFYGFDPDTDFYRVTNYCGFSGNSRDHRLSVEVLGRSYITDQALPSRIIEQLKKVDFLSSREFTFAHTVTLKKGFPLPTIRNLKALSKLNDSIKSILPGRVIVGGAGTDGLFFQNEVAEDIYEKAKRLCKSTRLKTLSLL